MASASTSAASFGGASTTIDIIFAPISARRKGLPHFAHIVGSRVGEFGMDWFGRVEPAVALTRGFPGLELERV